MRGTNRAPRLARAFLVARPFLLARPFIVAQELLVENGCPPNCSGNDGHPADHSWADHSWADGRWINRHYVRRAKDVCGHVPDEEWQGQSPHRRNPRSDGRESKEKLRENHPNAVVKSIEEK